MSSVPKQYVTAAQYLSIDRRAEYKSEFFQGEMFAKAGGTESHNLIIMNAVREVSLQFKGKPCKVYPSDMRVKVSQTGLYTYADVTVVCGEARFDEDAPRDTLLNPTVLFEVSESTEAYDRGQKFAHYRRIPSLKEYVLISQDRPRVEHFVRQPDGQWLFSEVEGLDQVLHLPSIGVSLSLAELFDRVEFPAAPDADVAAGR
ncbi:MAG TPA: Uma2 family endonuclease [Planctomycetaceae bacterium]|nr:Uma2 family endonuclease [Planctomycetaceae bacterium]